MTYRLHYISADGPTPEDSWSVYSEEYLSIDHEEPIDGSGVLIATCETEAAAAALADHMQEEWDNRKKEFA